MTASFQPLVPNPTNWMKVVEQTSGERWDTVDVDIIRRFKNPATCPEHLLPFLAFELSVDVWDDDWPVEKKRSVIASSIADHRVKGTLDGIRRYLTHAGAGLVRAIVPPAKTFLGASITEAERAAWVARFPQLRIYPYIASETIRYKTFANVGGGYTKAFCGYLHPYDAHTRDRYKRTAFLFEPRDGSLVSLEHRIIKHTNVAGEAVDIQEMILPGVPSTAIYAGQKPRAHNYFGVSGIHERVVTVQTPLAYGYTLGQAQYITVPPSLDPIDVRPVLVQGIGAKRNGSQFANTPLSSAFLPKSTAWQRIYETIYLHDPARLPASGARTTHIRATRLGNPVKTAKVRARITGKRRKSAAGRYVCGFMMPKMHGPLEQAIDALAASKTLSDVVLLNPKSLRKPRVGDRLKIGQLRVGELIPA